MAYGTRSYDPVGRERTREKGFEMRSSPFAVPAGDPTPNVTDQSVQSQQTTPAVPAVTAAAQAKKLFKPKQNVLASHKLAYDLGFRLGKSAAYPLQETTPQGNTMQNVLPAHVPALRGTPVPKVIHSWSEEKKLKKPEKLPPKPKPSK